MEFFSTLLMVSASDPDDARRRKLLNILLSGMAILALITLIASVVANVLGWVEHNEAIWLTQITIIMIVGTMIIFGINRYGPGWLASSLFLLVMTVVFVFSDNPKEIVEGRSLFLFAIPILTASVLLKPWAGFVMAAIASVLVTGLAHTQLQIVPPIPSLLAFFVVALVAWLSSRSLEQALQELRDVNRELDARVAQRTQDLADALAREHAEASRGQAILESIADGVIVFDNVNRAIAANPAITRLIRQPADRILSQDVEALMSKDVDQVDREVVRTLLVDRATRHPSVKLRWADKTLSVSLAPVHDQRGNVTGTVAVFRDFTREAELDKMKSDFVSIASHELRTPLTSIRGYLDLILMGAPGPLNPQQQNFLQIAKDNTDRLHLLVNDLLDISRIESGRIELNITPLHLQGLIENIVTLFGPQFEEKGLKLLVDVPSDLSHILADPDRITQVLANLVSNALKYTPKGSVSVRAHQHGRFVQVDVKDSGIGISPVDQEKLFSRFFRADDTFVREQGGTGLGLSITKSLVEMHGGKIWAESKLGQGSTFSVLLPLPGNLQSEAPQSVPQSTRTIEGTRGHVLVVDNEPDVAHLFRSQLEREGYIVDVITRGSEVISAARRSHPDLITLDLLMDIDGLTVLRDLKADPETANIPVIIASVLPQPGKGLALGAADYLIKPLDHGELVRAVEQVLGGRGEKESVNILAVDDDPDIRRWIQVALTHEGYTVQLAADGVEALQAIDQSMPDLVLLDLLMPKMDGRATLQALRAHDATRDLPVIVLTALSLDSIEGRDRMLSMGGVRLLHKPVSGIELAAEIERVLTSRPIATE
ncbi:MAG: response regulator [Chloroflexi bacterium]|nr:response regulator [Chloroflexota bacterium]